MKKIFINDIPVVFNNLNNSKLKVESYDTLLDGSSGIISKKLHARVLIYDASPDSIDSLLKLMTKKKLKKGYSITFTLKNNSTKESNDFNFFLINFFISVMICQ